jgi:cell division cycle 20-like protein 1 (cofactor of APC complex)
MAIMDNDAAPNVVHQAPLSVPAFSAPDHLSPANRYTAKDASTPNTQASSTAMSIATSLTIDGSALQRSDESSSSSSHSSHSRSTGIRVPLPSPSRARLDRRYAQRLAVPAPVSTAGTPPRSSMPPPTSLSSSILLPPGITRDSNASIFRPVPIVTPTITSESPSTFSPRNMSHSPRHFSFTRNESSNSSLASTGSSPTRRRRLYSDLGTSDRYIPNRATSNMNLNLWDSMNERNTTSRTISFSSEETNTNDPRQRQPNHHNNNNNNSNTPDDPASDSSANTARPSTDTTNTSSQQNLHNVLLRSELLGENTGPYSSAQAMAGGQMRSSGTGAPLRDGVNRLRFQSSRQAFQENIFYQPAGPTSVVNSFSLTPVGSAASQRLMAAPQKRKRRIAKVPFKVLDAPALQDDFYLNLVDWSSQNVLAVGLGSCVYLWSACTSKVTKLCDLAQTEDIVTSVSWAQRGTHLAVGTNRGEVQLWDSIQCKKVRTMTGHSARVGTLAWNGPVLASGSRDRLIFLRDVRVQSAFTDRLSAHKQEVCGLKWSFDEPSFLASGGNDNQLHVVDSRNPGQPVHRFSDHTAAVKAIAWSPHQHGLLASGGGTADRCIRFWNTLSGSALNCVDTGSQVCNLAWSKNCNEIVSTHGYSLNQIVVWRYPNMSKVVTLTGHTYRVLYLAMSPDGSTIVTGAGDETLRFWQVFPGPTNNGKNNAGGLLFPNTLGSVIR